MENSKSKKGNFDSLKINGFKDHACIVEELIGGDRTDIGARCPVDLSEQW